MMKKTRNNKVVALPPGEAPAGLGPFQRKARNLGVPEKVVRRRQAEWPMPDYGVEGIEDALYEAGFKPGAHLLRMAAMLWKYLPR